MKEAVEKNCSYRIKVFIDTNVLLKGFLAYRTNSVLPDCFTDVCAERYTFEKCVYEVYMAFRGVGGKKPDEGRGDWAQRHLRRPDDPSPMGALISKYHDGNTEIAYFWVNQILEAMGSIGRHEAMLADSSDPEHQKQIIEIVKGLRGLAEERRSFEGLCWDFLEFIRVYGVTELPYAIVFNVEKYYADENGVHNVGPDRLDSFVRDTVFPSEDFEVVYAALRIGADVFVTDDARLRTCSMSLGLNYALSSAAFCSSSEYLEWVEKWRVLNGFD
jgi:hypothetical protein